MSSRPRTAPSTARRMSYASMRAEMHSGGGLRMTVPAAMETWPLKLPPKPRSTEDSSLRPSHQRRAASTARPSTGGNARSDFSMRMHNNRSTLGAMSPRTLLRAPIALRQPLTVYIDGDVRSIAPVHPGGQKIVRGRPEPVAPTPSFADKQEAVAPFVDGDRVRPAMLTAYWPSPPSRRCKVSSAQTALVSPVHDEAGGGGRRVSDEAVMLMEIVKTRLNHFAGQVRGWDKLFLSVAGSEEGSLNFEQFLQVIRGPGKMPETFLSVRECRIFFEQADLSGTGTVSYDEFGLLVHSSNPKFELHMEALKAKLRASGPQGDWLRVFKFYDADKSGTLSIEELKVLVRQEAGVKHEQLSDKDIEKIFMLMDKSHRGVIRSSNFVSFLQEPSPRYERVVQLARTKINACKPPQTSWQKMLLEFDNDGSGHISTVISVN